MSKPQWLQTGWATHCGRRPVNEDAVLVTGAVMIVADGVGGAPRGDLASLQAIETVRDVINEPNLDDPQTVHLVASELDTALNLADDAVKALAERWASVRGTATTMCAAIAFNDPSGQNRAVVANVGDSRCYQIRSDQAHQITTDQTLATELEQAGVDQIGERAHHIVTSVLGGQPEATPTISLHQIHLEPDDILLLCTDGISGVLPPDELAAICITHRAKPHTAAAALVRAAWDANSTDNLTAIVARITHETGQE